MENEATRPVPELRARSVGEIIDAAMKLYFARWKTFIPVAAVFMVPYAAVTAIAGTGMQTALLDPGFMDSEVMPTPEEFFGVFAPFALIGLVALILYPVLAGALSWAAARTYLGDNPPPGRVISFAFSKFGPLLLVSILTGLVLIGVILVPTIPLFILSVATENGFILGLIAIPIVIILGIVVVVRLILAPTALVVENSRGVEALKRSWNLVKGSFWKVVGTTLLASILTAIIQAILTAPFSIFASVFIEDSPALSGLMAFIGSAIGGSLITPFGIIVQVLIYFDLRIRKEAFDLSLMAQQLEQ